MPAFCMTIALRPGGLDARWVPLPGASLADCRALIGDWLGGWNNQRSFHGPALIIIPAGESALAGHVGLGDRGDRVVELVYRIALTAAAAATPPGPPS